MGIPVLKIHKTKCSFSDKKVMSQMTLLKKGKMLVYLKHLFKESKEKRGFRIFFFLLSLSS